MADDTIPARLSADEVALAHFKALADERIRLSCEAAVREAAGEGPVEQPPLLRLRATKDKRGRLTIDLSKADKLCERCKGTGRLSDFVVETKDDDGCIESVSLPRVCRCVHRNGGVAKDALDRLIEKTRMRSKWSAARKERRRVRRVQRKTARRKP